MRVKHGQAIGVIVVDDRQIPLYFNYHAVRILAYPVDATLAEPIHVLLSKLMSSITAPANDRPVVIPFYSGRRRCICRMIRAENVNHDSAGATVISLERLQAPSLTLDYVVERFGLTERERQVTCLMLDGLSDKEIAIRLNLSPNTVRSFTRVVRAKTGSASRFELMSKLL